MFRVLTCVPPCEVGQTDEATSPSQLVSCGFSALKVWEVRWVEDGTKAGGPDLLCSVPEREQKCTEYCKQMSTHR